MIESPTFLQQATRLWTEAERLAFISWIAKNLEAGDVIPGADGARKARWSVRHKGKRGGVRVIYFSLTTEGVVYLIAMYQKSERATLSPRAIRTVR